MTLASLLSFIGIEVSAGEVADIRVSGLCIDSREIVPGALFVAVPGTSHDGRLYAAAALRAGACAVVGEGAAPPDVVPERWFAVSNARRAVALLAARLYGHPDRELDVYAVTGTNGKTTTATLLHNVLTDCGISCGLISTVSSVVGSQVIDSVQTTPDATVIYRYLREMRMAGMSAAAIEVSSHALAQHRVAGMRLAVAAFTNLSQDHLDYHGSMESYARAKRKLFEQLGDNPAGLAVVNLDDREGHELLAWLRESAVSTVTYGLDAAADYRAEEIELSVAGTSFRLVTPTGRSRVASPLLGRHNVSNLLAVAAMTSAATLPPEKLAASLSRQQAVRGRMERVITSGHPAALFIDYAHTPDALARVLEMLREVTLGRLIVVFGCGGDRDRTKRPLMGSIAYQHSDCMIVTSDNPRGEYPAAIIDDIIGQLPRGPKIVVEPDRREAIRQALELATSSDDVVLVAGKGHETDQIFAERRIHFDDREELLRFAGESV